MLRSDHSGGGPISRPESPSGPNPIVLCTIPPRAVPRPPSSAGLLRNVRHEKKSPLRVVTPRLKPGIAHSQAVPGGALPRSSFVSRGYVCRSTTVSAICSKLWIPAQGIVRLPDRTALLSRTTTANRERHTKHKDEASNRHLPDANFCRHRSMAGRRRALIAAAIAVSAMIAGFLLLGVRRQGSLLGSDASLRANDQGSSSRDGIGALVHHMIEQRAAMQMSDSFRDGMQAWSNHNSTLAHGWSRHRDGYVRPGSFAIFKPSLSESSYRLEFLAQIERKSIDWVVRAQDAQNYHAIKLTLIHPGLRPFLAIEHYTVTAGRREYRSETPLSIMVHNDRAVEIAVDVQGERIITAMDGQEIDSWSGPMPHRGAVGFFSDAGEQWRLYWMRTFKNQDFVGRVCAYLLDRTHTPGTAVANWLPLMPGVAMRAATKGSIEICETA